MSLKERNSGCFNVRKDLIFSSLVSLSLFPLCLNLKYDKKRLDDWDHRRAAIPSVLVSQSS